MGAHKFLFNINFYSLQHLTAFNETKCIFTCVKTFFIHPTVPVLMEHFVCICVKPKKTVYYVG